MEHKKQATTASHPMGMCEKLFNAFQPTLQPLRRLTFRQQEAVAATASSLPPPLPQPAPPPKEKTQHSHKAKDHKEKARSLPSPAPPKAEMMPIGTVPEAVPPPPPAKTKRGINERVDSYIVRTKEKIRSGSGLGRAFSSK